MSVKTSPSEKRVAPDPWDIGFGAIVFVGALLALFVWFPSDIRGGFFNINQIGRPEPGDAFFPILLASALVLLSLVQMALVLLRPTPPDTAIQAKLTLDNVKFLGLFLIITASGLAIMFWFGPVVVWTMREAGLIDATYRQLTDTAPYKYLGYVVGGFLMTMTLIAWTEGRVRVLSVVTVSVLLALFILIFDILLNNVLLPPNAEF